MNIGLVSCDWLSVSCMLSVDEPRPSLPHGYRLERMGPTAVWAIREFLLDADGNKVATFLHSPRSTAFNDPRRMVIEVANPYLYRVDWEDTYRMLMDVYLCSATGMSRFDLCCDFEMTEEYQKVINGLVNGSVYKVGARNDVLWRSGCSGDLKPHQLSWGAADSAIHWKLYNKFKEIHQDGTCSKPYIRDAWRAVGMDERKVWRLEVSVSDSCRFEVCVDGVNKRKLVPEDAIKHRIAIFQDFYSNRFVLRKNDGCLNRSRNKIVPFLNKESVDKLVTYAEPVSRRVTDAERSLLSQLWKQYQRDDKSPMVCEVLIAAIGRMLQKPSCRVLWKELTGMLDRDIRMRFPTSSNVPDTEYRNIRQLQLPIMDTYFESQRPFDRVVYRPWEGCTPSMPLKWGYRAIG